MKLYEISDEMLRLADADDKLGILKHLRETGEIIEGVEIQQGQHIRIY